MNKFFDNLKASKEKKDNESVHMTIDLILNEFLDDIENMVIIKFQIFIQLIY